MQFMALFARIPFYYSIIYLPTLTSVKFDARILISYSIIYCTLLPHHLKGAKEGAVPPDAHDEASRELPRNCRAGLSALISNK